MRTKVLCFQELAILDEIAKNRVSDAVHLSLSPKTGERTSTPPISLI